MRANCAMRIILTVACCLLPATALKAQEAQEILRGLMQNHLSEAQIAQVVIDQQDMTHESDTLQVAWGKSPWGVMFVVAARNNTQSLLCMSYRGKYHNEDRGAIHERFDQMTEDDKSGLRMDPGTLVTISFAQIDSPLSDAEPRYRFDYWNPTSADDDCQTVPKVVQDDLANFDPDHSGYVFNYFGLDNWGWGL